MEDRVLTRRQCRRVDQIAVECFGMPSIVLMENAGRECARFLESLGPLGPIAICCGLGNNGGDGLVIARHLANHGHPVHVLLVGDRSTSKTTADSRCNLEIVTRMGLPMQVIPVDQPQRFERALGSLDDGPGAWIVDALLGTGAGGPLRPPFDRCVAAINSASARRLAIDLPSKFDCDEGPTGLQVAADYTCSFVARKKGFLRPGSERWTGQIAIVDIGVPQRAIDMAMATEPEDTVLERS